MTKDDLLARISELRGALALIESDLATQQTNNNSLNEFQTVVDSTRRSVWTVLKAMTTDDYQQYVAGFRVRRASGVLKAVMDDLDAGAVPDVQAAQTLRDTLDAVVSTAPSLNAGGS